jgi:hypothetical protein
VAQKIRRFLDMQDDLRTDYTLILVGAAAAVIALAYLMLS